MKISHADHDELKTKKDPLEKYFSVFFFSTNFALNVAIFTFTMKSTFTFFTFQNRKNPSNSDILEMLPSWYISSKV